MTRTQGTLVDRGLQEHKNTRNTLRIRITKGGQLYLALSKDWTALDLQHLQSGKVGRGLTRTHEYKIETDWQRLKRKDEHKVEVSWKRLWSDRDIWVFSTLPKHQAHGIKECSQHLVTNFQATCGTCYGPLSVSL